MESVRALPPTRGRPAHISEAVDISAETKNLGKAVRPEGIRLARVRDALGVIFDDAEFRNWFSAEGRSGLTPGMLAMVCVHQAMEDLTDRDTADAFRIRWGWKYALGLGGSA